MTGPVVILTLGTREDVLPCVALGRGLRLRGRRVRILTSRRHAGLVTGAGLEHSPVTVDPQEVLQSLTGQVALAGADADTSLLTVKRVLTPIAETLLAEVEATCADAGAFLGPSFGLLGYHLHERHGYPCGFLQLHPEEPTRAFPSPLLPRGPSLGGFVNRAGYALVEQMSWQMLRPLVNRWRAEALGLPPAPASGPWQAARRAGLPVLCGFSAHVVPRPHDWPGHVHVTGYWHLDRSPDWSPPRELAAFLAAGPPPVHVAFDGAIVHGTAEVHRVVRQALRRAGVRGVLHGDPMTEPADEDVLVVDGVPSDWLLPRCAAVIHPGGAGTTAAALRAGVPAVACPSFHDQPFWASRIAHLGVGPAPVPLGRMRADTLAAAVRRTLDDPRLRAAAADLGRRLRAENGVERACDLIDDWLGDPGTRDGIPCGTDAREPTEHVRLRTP